MLLAVIVTVPVLFFCPSRMVRVLFTLTVKSSATAGETAVADTFTVVVSLDTRSSRAVTVVDPPFSLIEVRDSRSVTVGGSSSSVIVSSSSSGTVTP